MINTYHNALRDLINLAISKGKTGEVVKHFIGSDEIHDPTLIAQRIYGNRDDYDVVMVCAGTNAIWQPLPEKQIYLPTPSALVFLKKKHEVFW